MNSDTADLASSRRRRASLPRRRRVPRLAPAAAPARVEALAGERCAPIRRAMSAVRDSWRALWSSRLLVWVAGVGAVLAFGFGSAAQRVRPAGPHGRLRLARRPARGARRALGLRLVSGDRPLRLPARPRRVRPRARTAYFPLYPLGMSGARVARRAAGARRRADLAGARSRSRCTAIHRLTTLELARGAGGALGRSGASGGRAAGACCVMAFAPMAFFFSARVLRVAVPGAVGRAVLVRPPRALGMGRRARRVRRRHPQPGLVLAVPALISTCTARARIARPIACACRGRGDRRRPVRPATRCARSRRFRLRREVLWLALCPPGVALYAALTWRSPAADALAPFHAEQAWERHFAGPFVGVWDGLKAAFEGARQLLSFQRPHVYFPPAGGSPFDRRRAQPDAVRLPARGRAGAWACCAGCRWPTART